MRELARLNLGNFELGLPAFAGVAVGIRLYTGGLVWFAGALVALGISWALMWAGRFMLTTYPRGGAWIVESWIVSAVLVTAFVTDVVLWLTLSDWFPAVLGTAQGKTLEKLSATLVGAFATFIALVWTKDIADAKGYFWPSTQFRYGVEALYERLTVKPVGNTVAYDAIFMDKVQSTGIDGWSFLDRRARVGIIEDFMAKR